MPRVIEKTTLLSLLSGAADIQMARAESLPADVAAKATGRVYRKQLFTYGTWINPNWWWDDELLMDLTMELALAMKANFDNNTIGSKLTVPRNHTGDVNANSGEVIGFEVGSDAAYVYLDIRDEKTADDIDKGLIWDVSAGFDFDWVSQKDGSHHGPCLLHVALTDEPYINNMSGFEKTELAKRTEAFSKQFAIDSKPSVIMMSKNKLEEMTMIKLSTVKNDKEFPVAITYKDARENEISITLEAGHEVDVPTEAVETVEKQIADAVAPTDDTDAGDKPEGEGDTPSGDEGDKPDEDAGDTPPAPAPAEGGDDAAQQLAKANATIAQMKAEKEYGRLLSAGKITEAQKALYLSFATSASITLSSDVKLSDTVTLSKGAQDGSSAVALLSAILDAGPALKFAEQGAQGEDNTEVKLSDDERNEAIKKGYDPAKIEAARQKRNGKE